MKLKNNLPLLAISVLTLIGFVLRIWHIDKNPPSLNWDEVSHGYNAYSILKTGKDEWGISFPLIFRAFGDYKLPVYIYLTVLPIFLFGLNIFSVRLISVLAGTFAIPGIYLLTHEILTLTNAEKKAKKFNLVLGNFSIPLALVASLILTILPWHYFISRPALEANLALTLFIYGLWSLFKGLRNPRYFILSSILLSLTLHTYNTYRIFTPLAILSFLVIFRKPILLLPTKKLFLPILIFIVSFSLVISQMLTGSGTARYQKLAILNEQTVFQIGESRGKSDLPPKLARLIHNRPVYFVQEFTKNYFDYYSLPFLYQAWGIQRQFAIPYKNLYSLPIALLALIGIIYSLSNIKKSKFQILLALFFLSPVAAALTIDPPQALRPTPFIIFTVIFAALGAFLLIHIFPKRNWTKSFIAASLTLSVLLGFSRYLHAYWYQYRLQNSHVWQYGYKEAVNYINDHGSNYDRVFMTKYHGEPHIFYAFFSKLDPVKLQPNENNIRFEQSDWFWTDKIDNLYFVNDWEIPSFQPALSLPLESGNNLPTKNSLLFTSVEHLPSNTEILHLIEDLNGDIAFVVARFK